jgi:hypothetical protein
MNKALDTGESTDSGLFPDYFPGPDPRRRGPGCAAEEARLKTGVGIGKRETRRNIVFLFMNPALPRCASATSYPDPQ